MTVVLARPCSGCPASGCWPCWSRPASFEQAVETAAEQDWCDACGVVAVAHGRRLVQVRDPPSAGRQVTLLWIKRLWRCPEPRCSRRTWTERSAHVRPRASLTERARREACRGVGEDGLDVAAVADLLGVGWSTVMREAAEYGQPLVDDPGRLAGVVAVGVDETAFLAAGPRSATQFVTGIVAMSGPGRPRAQLLDIVPGRSKAAVQDWFGRCDSAWKAQIATASLDPFRGYATALTTSLPQAVRVLDAFHVVRLGQTAVDDVRRRRQQESLGRRGHREDPLSRVRRDLRRGLLTTTPRQWARIELALTVGDPSGQLAQAYMAGQELQFFYARSRDGPTPGTACTRSSTAAPAPRCPSSPASAAPSTPGVRNCWPTGPPPAAPVSATARPKRPKR